MKPDEQPLISLQTGPTVPVVKAIQELKAANDNMVSDSETAALRAQLKVANDNHLKDRADLDRVMKELRDLKAGVGFKRVAGAH